jgi:Protein of unknown function (DUF1778)
MGEESIVTAPAPRRRSEVRQRTELVALRLLPAERELLDRAALAQGVSLSRFIRASALAAARIGEGNPDAIRHS